MGLYDKMKTSQRLENEGIWLEIDGTRIRLARAGGKNTKFIAAAEKVAREHKRALDLMGEAQGRKIFGKLYAEIIVLDWLTKRAEGTLDEEGNEIGPKTDEKDEVDRYVRGIEQDGGKIVEFTVTNILKTFDDLPDLLKMIKETAEDASLFRQALVEGIEGN